MPRLVRLASRLAIGLNTCFMFAYCIVAPLCRTNMWCHVSCCVSTCKNKCTFFLNLFIGTTVSFGLVSRRGAQAYRAAPCVEALALNGRWPTVVVHRETLRPGMLDWGALVSSAHRHRFVFHAGSAPSTPGDSTRPAFQGVFATLTHLGVHIDSL